MGGVAARSTPVVISFFRGSVRDFLDRCFFPFAKEPCGEREMLALSLSQLFNGRTSLVSSHPRCVVGFRPKRAAPAAKNKQTAENTTTYGM